MNRSFSKIRHIQEANQRLEKRILKETMEFDVQGQQSNDLVSSFQNEMNNLGYSNIKLSDYVDTDNPVCTPQTENPEYNSNLEKVSKWASSQTNVDVLRTEAKNLIDKMRSITKKPVAEQVAATAAATASSGGGNNAAVLVLRRGRSAAAAAATKPALAAGGPAPRPPPAAGAGANVGA